MGMKITAKLGDIEITQDITITTAGGAPWTDDEIASLGIDAAAREYDGCLADEVALRMVAAGWAVVAGTWQSVGLHHVVQVQPAEIPAELDARVQRQFHCITAAESKRLGAPWCSPIGASRGGWWYLGQDGLPHHAGPAEIGEDGARAAAAVGMETRAFTL